MNEKKNKNGIQHFIAAILITNNSIVDLILEIVLLHPLLKELVDDL